MRAEWRAFRERSCSAKSYDAVIDLQGLTKSALVARLARGTRFGLANQTEGSSYEAPAGWLVDHAIRVEPHIHAMDRSRALVAAVLGKPAEGPPSYGLNADAPRVPHGRAPTVAFVHGTSRDDKLWPVDHWVQLGKRVIDAGWRIGLPQGNELEQTRAELIAAGLQFEKAYHVDVWPSLGARRGARPPGADAGRDRRGQRPEPHRRGAGPAARAALQLPDRLAHRAAGEPRPPRTRWRSKAGRCRRVQAVWLAWSNVLVAAS